MRSGWRVVFRALACAARDSSDAVAAEAFLLLERIASDLFHQIADGGGGGGGCGSGGGGGQSSFVECMNCLIAFGSSSLRAGRSLSAIDLIRQCTGRLMERINDRRCSASAAAAAAGFGVGPPAAAAAAASIAGPASVGGQEDYMGTLFPVLTGLSRLGASDGRPEVRARAVGALFAVLDEHGAGFGPDMWVLVFRGVLLPLFDDLRHLDEPQPDAGSSWLRVSGPAGLTAMVDLTCSHFDALASAGGLVGEVLGVLFCCLRHSNERVAEVRCCLTCMRACVRRLALK